jgi:hypothetical protein
MEEEKYLPIGTVVLLKEATKRVMITGYASISPDTGDKVFDYSGCIFPEGFFDYNQVCVFDHEQIAEVFYKGLEDDEEKEFMVNLKEEIERVKTEGIPKDEDEQ